MSEMVLEKNQNLPKGWIPCILDQIAILIRGVTYEKKDTTNDLKKNHVPILRGNNINSNLILEDLVYVPKSYVKPEQYLKKFDIIITMSSGSKHLVGKAAQLLEERNLSFGTFCGCIRPLKGIDEKFLGYFFQSDLYRKTVSNLSLGVNINNLRREHIEKLDFLLPPLNEQKRIVSKIDELFSKMDFSKQVLEKTKILLKQYSQSLLKSAFEGKLTEKWREDNKDNLEPASALLEKTRLEKNNQKFTNPELKCDKLYHIPKTWIWVSLEQICSKINDGTHFSPPNSVNGDVPYVTAKNIRPNKIDLTNITYISKKIHQDIYSRCNPEKGDVLYTKDGTVGYSAVNELDFEFSLLSSVALLKPMKNTIDPYFLSHYLNSPVNFYRIIGKMTGTALRRIILERIKEIPIPLAPLIEQKRIVSKIDEGLSLIDKNEKVVDLSLLTIGMMKKSILKHAFEGKLVPQDPNDEPAEILLEKIKQEKESQIQKIIKDKSVPKRRRSS